MPVSMKGSPLPSGGGAWTNTPLPPYNKFSADMTRYSQRLEGFAAEFSAILSRQLEESK